MVTDLGRGGAQVMLKRLAVGLQLSGVTNTVISLSGVTPHFESLRDYGVGVQSLGMQAWRPSLLAVGRLSRLMQAAQPDVVHTWMYHANLIGGVAARMAGVAPVVWGLHHTPTPEEPLKLLTRLVMRATTLVSSRVPARIACCAEAAREAHARLGYPDDRMVTITNGFDTTEFVPDAAARRSVRGELGAPDEAPLIGLMARFHSQKGHRTFISAAGVLSERCPTAHFVLAGTRVNRANDELRAWIQESGLTGRCHLLGLRDDMPRLMAACDIVTSAGLGEAFPLVLGEAMSCGVPCVTTDVGDSAALVGDTGLVVPPGDPDRLAAAWADLLSLPDDERRQLGQRARARVVSHFSLERCQREYLALYESVCRSSATHSLAG